MASKKQHEIDEMKWYKSEEDGRDACGTFDFCRFCDKTLRNPCEQAHKKLHARKKSRSSAKLNVNGKNVEFRSTISERQGGIS